jgi:predicted small lipoprotein YifL
VGTAGAAAAAALTASQAHVESFIAAGYTAAMNATPAPRQILIALSLVALPLVLAGCGNKGPLILAPKSIPVDPSTLPPMTPPAEPAPTSDEPTSEEPATSVPATDADDIDGKKKGTAEPTTVPGTLPKQADETDG